MDILTFSSKGSILLLGDFNSKTGKHSDTVCHDGNNIITKNERFDSLLRPSPRNSYYNEFNAHGKRFIGICKSTDLKILNGGVSGDYNENDIRNEDVNTLLEKVENMLI